MRKTRLLLGIALIVTGTAVGVLGVRSVLGDQTNVQAALLRSATGEADARGAPERKSAEKDVWEAARLEPLEAALRARVDGPTLVDLFENEDWWRSYRSEFPLVRVRVGDKTTVSRGPEVGRGDEEVVAEARKRQIASAIVEVGGQSYVMAAAHLPGSPEIDAVLLLGRPVTLAAALAPAVVPGASGPRFAEHPGLWLLALGIALGGAALVVSGRRSPEVVGAVVQGEIPHEPTSKFGTPARPRAPPAASELVTAPELRPGRITDGKAVSIRSPQGAAANLAVARQTGPVGVGAIFGRYKLVDRLGEGGMSELFVAEVAGVEGFTRNFVLKRLRPELARDKEAVSQFIDEARMQAGLVHSNIVPVFDFGVVAGEYFMTQEYIVGRDLARFVGRYIEQYDASLPEAMSYYIAHETLQALAYAHDQRDKLGSPMGIVHRDISASNVMVSQLGEVKLSDFGIVKSNRRVSKTQVGMVKGNANFMSPEQARGQAVDHRSDLFSLGHVLFYCLAGELLYTGENDLDVLYRAASGITPEDLARIRTLPDPAASVLEKALAFEPAERFQSAAEFADALAAHASGGKGATARMMQQLFGEELRRQVGAANAS
ncbi:MAG TPA: serine/threonine-protein kinase [Polyangia bacterium]|nr:serine/threonine-protein kinase [Polyangia bacterium]